MQGKGYLLTQRAGPDSNGRLRVSGLLLRYPELTRERVILVLSISAVAVHSCRHSFYSRQQLQQPSTWTLSRTSTRTSTRSLAVRPSSLGPTLPTCRFVPNGCTPNLHSIVLHHKHCVFLKAHRLLKSGGPLDAGLSIWSGATSRL